MAELKRHRRSRRNRTFTSDTPVTSAPTDPTAPTAPAGDRPADGSGRASLGSSLGWFVASYAVAILGYLALNAIASRLLGRDEFGYFVVINTVTLIVGELSLLGIHRAGLRDVAGMDSSEGSDLTALRDRVRVACLIGMPAAAVVVTLVAFVVASGGSTQDRASLALAVGVLTVLSGHQKLWSNMLRGFGRLRFAGLLEGRSGGALTALGQACAVGALWILVPSAGLASTLWAAALGFLLPVIVASAMVRTHWRHAPRSVLSPARIRDIIGRDWRFASVQLGSYVNGNLELWAAGLLLSAADTSLFGAAQRLSLLIATPLVSLQVVFSPSIARLSRRAAEPLELQRLLRTGATVAAVPMFVILVPILVFPATTMRVVFGADYSTGAVALVLILIGSVANVWSGLCGAVLMMTGHEGRMARVQWFSAAIRVVVGATAALAFGLDGLSASAGLVTAAMWCFMWWTALTRTQVRTDPTIRPQLGLLRSTVG